MKTFSLDEKAFILHSGIGAKVSFGVVVLGFLSMAFGVKILIRIFIAIRQLWITI